MINKETEIKFRLNEDMKEKLKGIKTTAYEETDEYFSTKEMLARHTFLRIRRKKGKVFLQLKDITNKTSQYYEADEMEIELTEENCEKMRQMLLRTFPLNFTVKKIRNKGFFNECEICIDTVEELGDFLEIEGPKEKIIETCKNFALDPKMIDTEEGYAHMIARKKGLE